MKNIFKKMAIIGTMTAIALASASIPASAFDRHHRHDYYRGGWHEPRGCETRYYQPRVYYQRGYDYRYYEPRRHHRSSDVATAAVVTAAASLIAIGTVAALSGY